MTPAVDSFGAIPAGDYTVKFELSGMSTETKRAKIGGASVLETPQVSRNLSAKMIDDLPINRSINATASLAPGVQHEHVLERR